VSPEAWAGGPIARVRDGDIIRLTVNTRALEGSIDVIAPTTPEFAKRERHPGLRPDPRVPSDTRLWAALQSASGGSWGGCVYDVERISRLLELGFAAEALTISNFQERSGPRSVRRASGLLGSAPNRC
jgi:hypothetical protein